MKIAIITEDGKKISRHFGRAPFYLVVTIEEGVETAREMRPKLGHNQFSQHGHGEQHGAQHGTDDAAHGKHGQMVQNVADCEAVICGGMGMGAYDSLRRLNIRPIVTDLEEIDPIIQAYLRGTLADHPEMLH